MNKVFNLVIVSLLLILSGGCREENMISLDQEILFQMDYLNYAWGYQHYGILIDNQGRILTYNNPDKWNFTDDNFILPGDRMAENISMCSILDERVSREDILKFSSYIDNIAASKVTALKNTGADGGILQFICYKYSENSLMYKGFMMKTEGDFTAENLNFYSKKVVSWLKDIDENISSR